MASSRSEGGTRTVSQDDMHRDVLMVELQGEMGVLKLASRMNEDQQRTDIEQGLFDDSQHVSDDGEEVWVNEVHTSPDMASGYWISPNVNLKGKSKNASKSSGKIGKKGKKRIAPKLVDTVIEDYFRPLDPTTPTRPFPGNPSTATSSLQLTVRAEGSSARRKFKADSNAKKQKKGRKKRKVDVMDALTGMLARVQIVKKRGAAQVQRGVPKGVALTFVSKSQKRSMVKRVKTNDMRRKYPIFRQPRNADMCLYMV